MIFSRCPGAPAPRRRAAARLPARFLPSALPATGRQNPSRSIRDHPSFSGTESGRWPAQMAPDRWVTEMQRAGSAPQCARSRNREEDSDVAPLHGSISQHCTASTHIRLLPNKSKRPNSPHADWDCGGLGRPFPPNRCDRGSMKIGLITGCSSGLHIDPPMVLVGEIEATGVAMTVVGATVDTVLNRSPVQGSCGLAIRLLSMSSSRRADPFGSAMSNGRTGRYPKAA